MYTHKLTEQVILYISENNTWNWAQHPDDEGKHPRFITYIAGNNYSKLDRIVANLPYPVRAIRRDAKAFKHQYTYELKIWGLRWDDAHFIAQAIANKEQPIFKGVA